MLIQRLKLFGSLLSRSLFYLIPVSLRQCFFAQRQFSMRRRPIRSGLMSVRRKQQRGQVMIGAFAVMIIGTVMLLMMVKTAGNANEKIRLVNAADAAAYSAGTVVARRMNYMAYSNRAMVANHVAAGHLASYVSWARYIDVLAEFSETDNTFHFVERDGDPGTINVFAENSSGSKVSPSGALLDFLHLNFFRRDENTFGSLSRLENRLAPEFLYNVTDMNDRYFQSQLDAVANAGDYIAPVMSEVVRGYFSR